MHSWGISYQEMLLLRKYKEVSTEGTKISIAEQNSRGGLIGYIPTPVSPTTKSVINISLVMQSGRYRPNSATAEHE